MSAKEKEIMKPKCSYCGKSWALHSFDGERCIKPDGSRFYKTKRYESIEKTEWAYKKRMKPVKYTVSLDDEVIV